MQTRSQRLELKKVNPEIEKYCKKNWKEKREHDKKMAERAINNKVELYKITQCLIWMETPTVL